MLKTNDPAHFMIDLGTDRGFMFAYEVWKRDEWRGDRARLQREARAVYANTRGIKRAITRMEASP